MPRKKLARPLPALRRNRSLARADDKIERLSQILRDTAKRHQTKNRQIFYAVRHVAERFNVSLSLVAAVYRQLESEGLLTRVRGSRTLLEGVGSGRQVIVHAIVGVPMALSSFLTRQKYRMFFMGMLRELRRRGFVTAGLLYETGESKPDLLLERIRHCHVDSVLWYAPERCARQTASLLRDAGLRVVGINDGALPSIPCRYEIRREKAVVEILRDWKARDGIRKVQIVRGPSRSATEEERMIELLEQQDLSHEFISARNENYSGFLQELRTPETGILLPGPSAAFFALRSPEALIELMDRGRVALVDGPVTLPFVGPAAARADLAVADWPLLTTTIVNGLLTKEAFEVSTPIILEAEAKLRAPLSAFAQSI